MLRRNIYLRENKPTRWWIWLCLGIIALGVMSDRTPEQRHRNARVFSALFTEGTE